MTYSTTPCLCPECGYGTNASDNMIGKGRPKPNDFTICLNCGALLQFDEQLNFKVASDEEVRQHLLPKHIEMIEKAQTFIRERGPIENRNVPN